MRFYTYIREEYCCRTKAGEIYVNPSRDDIKDMLKKVEVFRFTADAKLKKLFVWDANNQNHHEVVEFLKRKNLITRTDMKANEFPYFFNSSAEATKSGILVMDVPDDLYFGNMIDKMKQDWSWLKPYFTNLDRIDKLRISATINI